MNLRFRIEQSGLMVLLLLVSVVLANGCTGCTGRRPTSESVGVLADKRPFQADAGIELLLLTASQLSLQRMNDSKSLDPDSKALISFMLQISEERTGLLPLKLMESVAPFDRHARTWSLAELERKIRRESNDNREFRADSWQKGYLYISEGKDDWTKIDSWATDSD